MAKTQIELKLPANFNEIDISKFIELRNKRGFKDEIKAFHSELNRYLDNSEQGSDEEIFENSLGTIWKDFSGQILQLGIGVANIGIEAWLRVDSSGATLPILTANPLTGTYITINSTISIKSKWKNTRTRRLSRRYLADISKIRVQ